MGHLSILYSFFLFTLARCNGYVPKIATVANFEPENIEDPRMATISNTYVRWIEDVGGQIVPILPWYSQDKVNEILSKTNGVLWLGGSRDLNFKGNFEILNKWIFDKIIEYNNNGTYYPLFAICQGFEMLHSFVGNSTAVLSNFNSFGYMLPIEIDMEKHKADSIFKFLSDEDFKYLKETNSTVHLHHLGIDPAIYEKFDSLNKFLNILAIGKDLKNQTFAAIVSAKNYPFYGVQFHPEKIKYDRTIIQWVNTTSNNIAPNDNLGIFFIDECRRNPNKIEISDNDKYYVINTYESLPNKISGDEFLYLFSKNDTYFSDI